MHFLIIFNQSLLPLLLIVGTAVGYHHIFHPDIKQIANFSLNLFIPFLIFDALTRHQTTFPVLIQPFLFMFLLTGIMILLGWLASKCFHLGEHDRTSMILSCSMVNIGNFGLPLIYFTYGQEAVATSVLIFVVFNIPLSTLAIFLSSDKATYRDMIADVFKIPIFYAMLLALIFTSLGLSMPSGLSKGIHLMAQGAIPLIIFVLGLQLADISLTKNWISMLGPILAVLIIRLLISPGVAHFILQFLSFPPLDSKVALVQTSGPSALLPLMYAIRFHRSSQLLSAIILATTLASGITLPILISLL